MEIYNLREKQEYIEEVILLEKDEWGSSKSIDEKVNSIKEAFQNPFFEKLILLDENTLVGFISIFEYDMDERHDLKPWYATMYVKKEYRGKRIF